MCGDLVRKCKWFRSVGHKLGHESNQPSEYVTGVCLPAVALLAFMYACIYTLSVCLSVGYRELDPKT